MGEVGRAGGHPDVAADGQVEAARERASVDGRHERQREREQAVVEPVRRRPDRGTEVGVGPRLLELGEVEPGAEGVTGARDGHTVDRGVVGQVVEGIAHVVTQLDREGVALVGAVEREQHPAVAAIDGQHVGHAAPSRRARGSTRPGPRPSITTRAPSRSASPPTDTT